MQLDVAKILQIRHRMGIPTEGFQDEGKALDWYREHYQTATGKPFLGGFGYRYDVSGGALNLDYKLDDASRSLTISVIPPLDLSVPLDREAWTLAQEAELDWFNAPAIRLVLLAAPTTEDGVPYIPYIPFFLAAPLGEWRLLVQPPGGLGMRDKRRYLDLHDPEMQRQGIDITRTLKKSVVQGFFSDRVKTGPQQYRGRRYEYLQVLQAYEEAERERPSVNWGRLKRTAEILVEKYNWPYFPPSYEVKHKLDRARKYWQIHDIERKPS